MSKFADLETRIRALLDDTNASRFSDGLISTAMRRALDDIDLKLPNIKEFELQVSTSGRDQPLTALGGCRYIMHITLPPSGDQQSLLEPETHFSYYLKDGTPNLHFSGLYIPAAGDQLTICYAAGYTIEGLDGESVTTLPVTFESPLVNGSAAEACLLRAGIITERYGVDPAGCTHLMEIGHQLRETFERNLSGLKVIQDFGFPPGFKLDAWEGRII